MWPYYSRTNYQKVRDAYLTTLKASSTASFDVPPNYTYRLQPMTCIHYNKQTQYYHSMQLTLYNCNENKDYSVEMIMT